VGNRALGQQSVGGLNEIFKGSSHDILDMAGAFCSSFPGKAFILARERYAKKIERASMMPQE